MVNENIYTLSTYSFSSITKYNEASNKNNIKLELLGEIGNAKDVDYIQDVNSSGTLSDDGKTLKVVHVDDDSNKYVVRDIAIVDRIIHSGNIMQLMYDKTNGYSLVTTSHYSRLRKYSSLRTLKEIVDRAFDASQSTLMLSKLTLSEGISISESENRNFPKVLIVDSEDKVVNSIQALQTSIQKIYPVDVWNATVWSGVGYNEISMEKTDENIFPVHENRTSDLTIDVRCYEDLLQANKNPNGKFVLRKDISVPANASPICSLGSPFTGSLYSYGTEHFKITIDKLESMGTVGLFSAVKGATFSNFDIEVSNEIKVTNSGNNSSAAGVLFGYGYSRGYNPNVISNVTITFTTHGKIKTSNSSNDINDFSAAYVGAVGGFADSLYIDNLTVTTQI